MLSGVLALLLCLLLGELASSWAGLPLPGAVLGMALLAVLLAASKRRWAAVENASDALLKHMPLLFVPAGVGVMQFAGTLRESWLPVAVTLVLGTLLTMAVTALTLRACLALQARGRPQDRA
jgi:putative effector of murein hydrolase LrgA (UPF0299 family)